MERLMVLMVEKTKWDSTIWCIVPWILNMAIVKVGEQNPINVAKFHKQLDNEFEYINHELIAWGFKDCVW